jgi:hypothetical protein
MLLFIAAFAFAEEAEEAGDDDFFWVGGGVAVRPGYMPEAFTLGGEVEADLLFQKGMVGGRLDLDFQGRVLPTLGVTEALPAVVPINYVRPEWAMLEVSGESWAARGGIVNAAFGLEDWDDRALYMPTHGEYFAYSPGRMAGSEFGWTFGDDGPTVTVGGGLDVDWDAPIIEANVNVEGDTFATWSGVAAYPADEMYNAVIGAEVYPAEIVTIALGGMVGIVGDNPHAAATLYGVFLPESIVNPTIRVEGAFDPGHAFDPGPGGQGMNPWAVGAGGAVVPTDWMKALVEAKITGTSTDPVPGVYLSLCFFTPDPAGDEDEDDE